MARQCPRFLYSDPQDTKSLGPFVVHTIYPKCLLRVFFNHQPAPDRRLMRNIGNIEPLWENKPFFFQILEIMDNGVTMDDMQIVVDALQPWLRNHLIERNSELPIKAVLIKLGFSFVPDYSKAGNGPDGYFGNYIYQHDNTFLILICNKSGMELIDGRPDAGKVYARSSSFFIDIVIQWLVKFGNNVS